MFASECNRLLKFYNFDGIDIDWEYPGYTAHSGTIADKANFTILMQQIRDSITTLGIQTGKTYKLSACFGASAAHASNIEWNNVVPILDMINVMSYDFFGAWDCNANHNSPLYAPVSGDPSFNLNSAFNLLTSGYGVPAAKINLGVAFYGRSQTAATALHAATSCAEDVATFVDDLGTPLYYNIVSKMPLFNQYWDNTAKVPYLLGKPTLSAAGTFVSFDNKISIGEKAQFVKNNNARGVIIWELTGDYIETFPGSGIVGSTPLIDTLNQVFCASVIGSIAVNSTTICSGKTTTLTANGATSYTWSNGANTSSIIVSPITSSTYTVSGTLIGSLIIATSTVVVTVINTPVITVNSGTVCSGNTFTINATGANTYVYSGGSNIVAPTTTTTYTVIGTGLNGCVNTTTCYVVTNPLPTINISSTSSLICLGESVNLNATGALSYTWNTGGSGTSISVSPIATTNYTVIGVGINGCLNSALYTQSVSICAGINYLNDQLNNVLVYPNPSFGLFTIKVEENILITIINTLGEVVFIQQLETGTHTINLSNIANGSYILKATSNNYTRSIKLIKN